MGGMEKPEIARVVRQAIIAELLVECGGLEPRPVLEQLSLVLDIARIAQRIIERLGLD